MVSIVNGFLVVSCVRAYRVVRSLMLKVGKKRYFPMEISFHSFQLIACHDPLLILTLSSPIGNLGIKHILKRLIRQGILIQDGTQTSRTPRVLSSRVYRWRRCVKTVTRRPVQRWRSQEKPGGWRSIEK